MTNASTADAIAPSYDDVVSEDNLWGIRNDGRGESLINHRHAISRLMTRANDVEAVMANKNQRRRSRFSQDMSLVCAVWS